MADSNEPKKETVRITVSPPPSSIDVPAMETPATAVTATPQPAPNPQLQIDHIPMPLCWTLLAVSAVILILQIWNYAS